MRHTWREHTRRKFGTFCLWFGLTREVEDRESNMSVIECILGQFRAALFELELDDVIGELGYVCCNFWLRKLSLGGPALV